MGVCRVKKRRTRTRSRRRSEKEVRVPRSGDNDGHVRMRQRWEKSLFRRPTRRESEKQTVPSHCFCIKDYFGECAKEGSLSAEALAWLISVFGYGGNRQLTRQLSEGGRKHNQQLSHGLSPIDVKRDNTRLRLALYPKSPNPKF